jgi:pyridoxal phosphate enzyme (YggS family)
MSDHPLHEIRRRVAQASADSPLQNQCITIIGASKNQPPGALAAAIAQGLTDFGENRVQEAQAKWPALKIVHPALRLHLIGPLQTNKVPEAVALFDAIHTVDRAKLIDALAAEMARQGRVLPCFIQVNTGEEPQKSGVAPREADALIAHAREAGLNLAGLMCVPPADQLPAPHFALLHAIARRNGLVQLSMGMSEDYETAVRLGATHVRIGRALFGERVD